jgi:hypothetical protein
LRGRASREHVSVEREKEIDKEGEVEKAGKSHGNNV